MIQRLLELKNKTEKVTSLNNDLKRITNEIINPDKKKLTITTFFIIFSLVYILCLFKHMGSDYSTSNNIINIIFVNTIISFITSLIITGVLYVPIILILKIRREKIFKKHLKQINSILFEINEVFGCLDRYPDILRYYLDVYYLDFLIEIMKSKDYSLDEALNDFKEEKRGNSRIQNKSKIADKRIFKTNRLFLLSDNNLATASCNQWIENYNF